MATGHIQLPIGAATLPDGSAGNAAPAIQRVQGTEANPKKHVLVASFDAATDEHLWWVFQMPSDYASDPTVELLWYTNDVGATETCRWAASIGAVTPADADTPIEHANAAISGTSTGVNTTEANRLVETIVALANADSVAADDLVVLMVQRDPDHADDDLTSDALLVSAQFRYTTS